MCLQCEQPALESDLSQVRQISFCQNVIEQLFLFRASHEEWSLFITRWWRYRRKRKRRDSIDFSVAPTLRASSRIVLPSTYLFSIRFRSGCGNSRRLSSRAVSSTSSCWFEGSVLWRRNRSAKLSSNLA